MRYEKWRRRKKEKGEMSGIAIALKEQKVTKSDHMYQNQQPDTILQSMCGLGEDG